MIPRQRPLISKKEFLALPEELQLQLANELLTLLCSDLRPFKPFRAKTDTSPAALDLNVPKPV